MRVKILEETIITFNVPLKPGILQDAMSAIYQAQTIDLAKDQILDVDYMKRLAKKKGGRDVEVRINNEKEGWYSYFIIPEKLIMRIEDEEPLPYECKDSLEEPKEKDGI